MPGSRPADVVVVGSGAAGLAAAAEAARAGVRVTVVTKSALQACNSAKAQGGIQAAVGEGDDPATHAADVWTSSHQTADRALVERLTGEGPAAIAWLERLGVAFDRDDGGYRLARCGGATRRRLLQVGDRTGHAITKALRGVVEATVADRREHHPLVAIRPRAEAGFTVVCAHGADRVEIPTSCVVLATGGRCFREAKLRGELSTNHPNATGEATALAIELGCQARDLDALQYHPNGGSWPPSLQGYSIPETTRAYGAVLLNRQGEEFTDSLGPRDVVAAAIVREVDEGRGVETPDGRPAVWLDTPRIPPADAARSLPYMLRRYRAAGVDPLAEPILTYPVLHYQNGGLVIGGSGETTVAGLFACGEVAGGTHGRNRMMGNSLLECCVFGRRAGRAAAERARG